jgi:sugar (pentulose or hexulose) kinase
MLPASTMIGRTCVVGSGNALRRNPLLQRMVAEEFCLPLELAAGQEESACGAAMNAMDLL